jgi:hypothetical protein
MAVKLPISLSWDEKTDKHSITFFDLSGEDSYRLLAFFGKMIDFFNEKGLFQEDEEPKI